MKATHAEIVGAAILMSDTETPQQEAERLLVTYVQSASLEPLGEYIYASSARDLLDWQITARREAEAKLAETEERLHFWEDKKPELVRLDREVTRLRRIEASARHMLVDTCPVCGNSMATSHSRICRARELDAELNRSDASKDERP